MTEVKAPPNITLDPTAAFGVRGSARALAGQRPAVTLTYTIDGTGWATATVTTSEGSVQMAASYLHDTLRNLAQVVLDLGGGESEGTVVFMDEPGEHQLQLRRSGDNVLVEIQWYDDWASWKLASRHGPKTLLTATVPLAELRRTVTGVLADVLEQFGVQGYREKWVEHDFPLAEYERLRAS